MKKRRFKLLKDWVLPFIAAFFIVAVLNSKVSANVQIKQSSMENTLFENQRLIVDKLSYNFENPQRGDIIIFFEDEVKGNIIDDTVRILDKLIGQDDSTRLVKRVIGIPGDKIDIKDGFVYLNGEKLDEPYVKGETSKGDLDFPIEVGENQLFVLGDNRQVSMDSRKFGLVDYQQVDGKAIFILYPLDKIGFIK